jgi:hypothetical protein
LKEFFRLSWVYPLSVNNIVDIPLREGYGYEVTFRMERGSEDALGLA